MIDKDTDAYRIEQHRRRHSMTPDFGPHPDVVAACNLMQECALLVGQAVYEVDTIVSANPVGYSDFGTNPRRHHSDKRSFTMKDAKHRAVHAARLLREAWEMLDPSMSRPPQIHDNHTLRTCLVDLGWTPPRKAVDQLQCPTVAWMHPTSAFATTDPTAYTGLSAGKPRELILKNDVVDHIDWLEHGIDEWRAVASALGKQLKELKS